MNKIKELYNKWFPKRDINSRVGLLDEARGLLVILMIIYHALYTLTYSNLLSGTQFFFTLGDLFYSPVVNILRDIGAGLFIFICGASCVYSRNNFKRGAIIFIAGILVTIVTVYFVPDKQILWGILHCLGLSIVLYDFLAKPLSKLKWWLGVPIFAVLSILTFGLANTDFYFRHIGVPFVESLQINTFSLVTSSNVWGTISRFIFPLGITAPNFSSPGDWFPIFPWIFILFIGTFYGRRLKEGRALKFAYKTHVRPLAFVGRHALVIYLLHQPIIYGILALLELII